MTIHLPRPQWCGRNEVNGMKLKWDFLTLAVIFTIPLYLMSSCDRLGADFNSGNSRLCVSFVKGGELFTRAALNLPDTSAFLLKIKDAGGNVIYDGKYGDCPESLDVSPGSYNVRVVSSEFTKPAFDAPQFGDEQCVLVPENGVGHVRLLCRQINAGVRLKISSGFLTQCPQSVLFVKSAEGQLMYSYTETRIAYFLPGTLSLVMNTGNVDQVLMVKDVRENEILSIGVSVPEASKSGDYSLSVSIDTARVWTNAEYIIGVGDSGHGSADALSVADARNSAEKDDVWVCGYIVGGDLTSASASFKPPFESRTNIILGPRSTTVDKNVCLSVQLPSGEVRDALNLVDNPSLLGKRVCIKGDLVSAYYGIPGIKNTDEYQYL